MADDESVYEVHTPTRSELATFQVLANHDFVNFNKISETVEEEELAESVSVRVVEEEAQENLTPHDFPSAQQHDDVFFQPEEKVEEVEEEKLQSARSEPVFRPQPTAAAMGEGSPRYNSFRPKQQHKSPQESKPSRYKDATKAEIEAEKEGLLSELHNLERQGLAKLVRPLSMDDSLEEIQFQYDRIQAELNANQMVDFAKSSIKMGSGMVEMLMKKAGIKVVDGYHNNLCKDMNKFNRPLNRLYKKYWRRGGLSPEAELGMLVLGSLAWTVVQNKMGSATAAFSGSDAPPPPSEPKNPTAAASRPMKPPQMSSLNVPASWSSPIVPPPQPPQQKKDEASERRANELLKEAEEKMRVLQIAQDELENRESINRRLAATLEEKRLNLELKSAELEAAKASSPLSDGSGEEEEEATKSARKVVVLQPTPKKSSRRNKNNAIDI